MHSLHQQYLPYSSDFKNMPFSGNEVLFIFPNHSHKDKNFMNKINLLLLWLEELYLLKNQSFNFLSSLLL